MSFAGSHVLLNLRRLAVHETRHSDSTWTDDTLTALSWSSQTLHGRRAVSQDSEGGIELEIM